jgi:hypothetical protein
MPNTRIALDPSTFARLSVLACSLACATAETARSPITTPQDPALQTVTSQGTPRLLIDPLTSPERLPGERDKRSLDGTFSPQGWAPSNRKGALVIELEAAAAREGALEVDVTGLDWPAVNAAAGSNTKIHFINMFSNPNGDHHMEDGGGADDALWTLRAGADGDGKARYGDSFKVLWASRGAKRAPGSDYHEVRTKAPDGWRWDPAVKYTFRVTWSQARGIWEVLVNGHLFSREPWKKQVTPMRYVWLGRGGDYASLVGARFSNLRVYAVADPHTALVADGKTRLPDNAIVLTAIEDFATLHVPGFVPFYKDKARGALAINTKEHPESFAAARTSFAGPPGIYDIRLFAQTERDGESRYRVLVGGVVVGEMKNPPAPDRLEAARAFAGVRLAKGDVIQVEAIGSTNEKEPEGTGFGHARGRWNRLVLVPNDASPATVAPGGGAAAAAAPAGR